jgi:hypothetical protein
MATDSLPWKSRFYDADSDYTALLRESSTYAYASDWVAKNAATDPKVVAAGGKGKVIISIDATPASMVPAPSPGPSPAPTPPSPSPAPEPSPTPPSPAPGPSPAWVEGKSTATEPTTTRPARGYPTPDPSFKQVVFRVTDPADPPKNFRRNDYSRRQAFNANNTRQLVAAGDGYWHLYDANKYTYVTRLSGPAGDAEPQWHQTNPDLMYYLPQNGVGMKVFELNVKTGVSRVVGDLSARLKALWPSAAAAWTKSEGSPSADGRYWCFMVDSGSWTGLGVVTWDMQTDTIVGSMPVTERPDHVSMSPSGNYAVVSSGSGTVSYTRDLKSKRVVNPRTEHSDIALLPNGDDAYVSVDYASNAGDVFFVNLKTGARTVLFPSYLSGTARAFHFSGKAYGLPGWMLMSAYGEYGGAQQWMDRKIILVELKAGGRLLNCAWHRSKVPSSDGYFFEPQATISRDGSRAAFTSGWGGVAQADLNAYQIILPPV